MCLGGAFAREKRCGAHSRVLLAADGLEHALVDLGEPKGGEHEQEEEDGGVDPLLRRGGRAPGVLQVTVHVPVEAHEDQRQQHHPEQDEGKPQQDAVQGREPARGFAERERERKLLFLVEEEVTPATSSLVSVRENSRVRGVAWRGVAWRGGEMELPRASLSGAKTVRKRDVL